MNLTVQDDFYVVSGANLGADDYDSLSLLYLPLIGHDGYALYMVLNALLNKETLRSDTLKHLEILDITNMSIKTIENARFKLEAVGLLNSYYNDSYIYCLKCPLLPKAFFKNPTLEAHLFSQVGERMFKRIQARFDKERINKTGFKSITKSFDDVFKSETMMVNIEPKGYLCERKESNPIKIKSENFNMEDFARSIKVSLGINRMDEDLESSVRNIAYLYGINELEMERLFRDSCDTSGIDIEMFKQKAKQFYEYRTEREKPNIEESTLSEDELLEQLDNASLEEILFYLAERRKPSIDEIKAIELFNKDMKFPRGVLNVFLSFVIKQNDGRLPSYNYLYRVGSEWARARLDTTKKAYEYYIERRKAFQNSKKSKEENAYTPTYKRKYKKNQEEDEEPKWLKEYIAKIERGESGE